MSGWCSMGDYFNVGYCGSRNWLVIICLMVLGFSSG